VPLTPKYVQERLFGVGARPGQVRILIYGVPRDAARWPYCKEGLEKWWSPFGKDRGFAVVLQVGREVARERFAAESRAGDVFEKRFDEHEEKIDAVMEAMRDDSKIVVEMSAEADDAVESIVWRLEGYIAGRWG
jgi:UMP-CMP kinase